MDLRHFPDVEEAFDRLVRDAAPSLGADPVCSTTRWIVPAATAFAPHARRHVWRGEHGMVALLEHEHPNGPVYTSFDAVWGFATPLIGPDPAPIVDEFFDGVVSCLDFYALSLSGVVEGSRLFDALAERRPVGTNATAERCVADLDGDFDAWLGRRSARFRRSLRAAVYRGEGAGVSVEHLSPAAGGETLAALDRVLAIEESSWKTDAASGLIGTDLGHFTRNMSQRFAAHGGLRLAFAMLDGRDVGYVIGGIVDGRYRGFQHSFDQAHADLSIGKILQYRTIESCCDEGVERYDMGMFMAYKQSYTDRIEASSTLIFANR